MFTATYTLESSRHPYEDAYAVNERNSVAAVADGVTLRVRMEYTGEYPEQSGSRELARVFCESLTEDRQQYSDIRSLFSHANHACTEVNANRSKYSVLSHQRNLFAATCAAVQIGDDSLEYVRLGDCGIAVVGADGALRYNDNEYERYGPRAADICEYEEFFRTLLFRTVYRNAVDESGDLLGYGIVTGEPEAERYLIEGTIDLRHGDTVLVYSDGFEQEVTAPAFVSGVAACNDRAQLENALKEGGRTGRNGGR